MPTHLRTSKTIRRETHQDYRRKALLIEIGPDGVFLWPKGTRQKVKLNLEACYLRALAGAAAPLPTGRQLGMTARRQGKRDWMRERFLQEPPPVIPPTSEELGYSDDDAVYPEGGA